MEMFSFLMPGQKKEEVVDEGLPKEDRLKESDEFYTKWSGPMIIGAFIPAVWSLIVAVGGAMTLGAWEGQCGYPLQSFISAAVAVAYMFLLVYSWIFLGDTIEVTLPLSSTKFALFHPFTSLQWVMGMYFVIFVTTFIVYIVGSFMLSLSSFCTVTAPLLYKFTSFLVITYWLGFCVVVGYCIKLYFGHDIASFMHEATREHTNEEMEERIFRKVFNEFDKDREGFIPTDDLGGIIQGLGVYVPDSEIATLKNTLADVDNPERIKFNPLYTWFQKVTAEADEMEAKNKAISGKRKGAKRDDDSDDD